MRKLFIVFGLVLILAGAATIVALITQLGGDNEQQAQHASQKSGTSNTKDRTNDLYGSFSPVQELRTGALAPTIELATLSGAETFDLSDFRGDKPVVLFFGSYT